MSALALKFLPEELVFLLELINDLILKDTISLVILNLPPKIMLRLIHHLTLILRNPPRQIIHNIRIILSRVIEQLFISQLLIVLFVLFYFLL